jgi:hypothetical protein
VIVDFARPGAAFSWDLWPGNVLGAEVARFPGSAPLRVLVADRRGDPAPAGPPPGWDGLARLADARGQALAADPWLERWPVSVVDIVPDRRSGRWSVTDRDGCGVGLTVDDDTGSRLLALSAGRPVQLLGEWDEDGITPLGVWADDRMVVL